MKKLFSTILVLSLLLSWNSYAGIFDLFQTSTSKCIKNLRKHTLLDRHTTFENSRDVVRIFNLDRVTGILSENAKGLTRIVEDGKYVKKSNGEWLRNLNYQVDLEYQCKKEDRLF